MKTFELFALLFIICIYTCLSGCRKDESNPVQPPLTKPDTLTLSVEDQTNISVTLKVGFSGSMGRWRFSLTRLLNGSVEKTDTFTVYGRDTIIYDNNDEKWLLADTVYTYRVKVPETGDTASVVTRTLSYTSHNYEWTQYSFGIGGYDQSSFEDVWGTSANNVYACGSVSVDENGKTVGRSMWHWDGSKWSAVKSMQYGSHFAMYGFNENDIWSVGVSKFHFDGVNWNGVDRAYVNGSLVILDTVLFSGYWATAVWGTSSSNLYIGTLLSKLVHWNGKKASLVTIPSLHNTITDIYGTSADDIYLTTGQLGEPELGELFHYDGNSWNFVMKGINRIINPGDVPGPYYTVWAYNRNEAYLGASYSFYMKIHGKWEHIKYLSFRPGKIRGTKPNNIFIAGSGGNIVHFNGRTCKSYKFNPEIYFYGIYVTENEVFVAGRDNLYAYIFHGRRIN